MAVRKHIVALAFIVCLPSVALGTENFGIAASDGNAACISVRQPIETLPHHVEIVVPDAPQRVLSGSVTSLLQEPCAALDSRDLEGPFFFALRFTSYDTLSSGELGIAHFAPKQARTFRSCTSNEGVHLTVWASKALESKRIWHEYVYLGYDVEPSCSRGDFEGHADGA